MGVEIERKFLVEGEAWRDEVVRAGAIRQNYLARGQGLSVRVRTGGPRAWLGGEVTDDPSYLDANLHLRLA